MILQFCYMSSNGKIISVALCCHLFIFMQTSGYPDNSDIYKDQTSSRPNTLIDDADDIQKQLDNEARDRLKYGRPKTIWVFHFPTTLPGINIMPDVTRFRKESKVFRKHAPLYSYDASILLDDLHDWNYKDQNNWYKYFPECGGRSQSPVDIPAKGLLKSTGARPLLSKNYNTPPQTLTLMNNGRQVILYGKWKSKHEPLLYGGAAHSRRYVFHSLSLLWPSEHTIGGLQYPLESQLIHISAQYNSIDEAIAASSRDRLAILAVSNLYKYSNCTQNGIQDLIMSALHVGVRNVTLPNHPLGYYSPPFKRYASYQGSLTTPPCTQTVLWIIRAKALPVTRKTVEAAHDILSPERIPRNFFNRQVQPLNDRKIYYFN